MILLNAPLVGQRLGYPDLSAASTCSSCSPSSIRRASRCRRRRASPCARPRAAGERGGCGGRRCCATPRRLLDRLGDADWPEREGAWTGAMRRCTGCAGPGRRLVARAAASGPSAPSAGCSRGCPNGRRARRAAAAAHGVGSTRRGASTRLAELTGAGAEPREGQRRCAAAAAGVFAPRRARGRAEHAARRGGHRDRQDAGLSRAGLAVGRAGRAARSGSRPSPRRCSASSTREGARLVRRRRRSGARRIVVRKGRENYLCLLNLEDALQGGFAGRAAILAQLVGALGGLYQGRRHGRRRPAGLAAEPVPPRRRDRADRPARRMRLCRLPALPEMLHRARRARRAARPTWSSPTMRW